MTNEVMALRAMLEKGTDADLLRERSALPPSA